MTDIAPLKFHGGKTYLAPKIIELFPEHVHYVEPFFGGGAVLFAKPPQWIENHSEVINDIHGDLMNFWRVLRSVSMFDEFHRQLLLTPFGSDQWNESLNYAGRDPVEGAVAFFVRYRQSRQGLGACFATMSRTRTRRGMNEQVSSWLSAVDSLPEAHERLSRVVIFNDNAISVIRKEDDPKTFFYCDPPYIKATRVSQDSYEHEMSDQDHQDLLTMLSMIKGKFLLSGYKHPMYEEAARSHGWRCVEVEIDNKASSQKTKPKRVECLWMNYEVQS